MSGVGITVLSGTQIAASNAAGYGSGNGIFANLFSGRITADGFINAQLQGAELLSGVAVSGARAYLHALGY